LPVLAQVSVEEWLNGNLTCVVERPKRNEIL
jgi:hypothetical protein